MEEEVAAAHSSTQQPDSFGQKGYFDPDSRRRKKEGGGGGSAMNLPQESKQQNLHREEG